MVIWLIYHHLKKNKMAKLTLKKMYRGSPLTLESRIDVGQGINVGLGKFVKKLYA